EARDASINLNYEEGSYIDGNRNQHRQLGGFVGADGSTKSMTDVWFLQDKTDTEVYEYVEVGEDIGALPNLIGFGNVYDLHQAMVKDISGQLKSLIGAFAAEGDPSKRMKIIDEIIFKWVGADQYSVDSRGVYALDARKIYAVEAFTGELFVQSAGTNEGLRDPGPNAAAELDNAFNLVHNYYYSQLLLQTHFVKYTSESIITFIEGGYNIDTSGVVSVLRKDFLSGDISAAEIVIYFDSLKTLGVYGEKLLASLRAEGDLDGGAFDSLIGAAGFSLVLGTSGGDNLNASAETNSFLLGLEGDDRLYASTGNNILHGGAGNDTLSGGAGANQLYG
ncbi:calcium-binding protein, partial [Pseudomonas corrugata]|uniref:calcium-binding protein n=1 Tax=Pseudomonas corrugata TaxID=47879 RepID=UPI001F515AAE